MTFRVVECSTMHDGQVILQAVLGGDSLPAPDSRRISDIFDTQCVAAFNEFTGTHWENSRLSMWAQVPTEADFKAGHRNVTCVMGMYDGTRFAGSALGKSKEEQFEHSPRWEPPTDTELYGEEAKSRV